MEKRQNHPNFSTAIPKILYNISFVYIDSAKFSKKLSKWLLKAGYDQAFLFFLGQWNAIF
jgi:hypothetical protein